MVSIVNNAKFFTSSLTRSLSTRTFFSLFQRIIGQKSGPSASPRPLLYRVGKKLPPEAEKAHDEQFVRDMEKVAKKMRLQKRVENDSDNERS